MRVMFLSTGSFRGKAVAVLLVLCLFIFFLSRGVRNYYERIISIELFSLNFPGQISISQKEQLREIEKQLTEAQVTGVRAAGEEEKSAAYKLVMNSRKGSIVLVFHDPGRLLDPAAGNIYILRDGGRCLKDEVKQLENKSPYGEYLAWDEAKELFRKYDKARIIDFETQMSFMVQRRAGSLHADVQPLTAEDSAVMKTIYGGKWSWRRRAIIVEVRGRRLAASMNGMPHGAGAIGGNNFAGHFCIHFRESKTHSKAENLAHQIMIWKSAGKVMDELSGAEPDQVVRVMITAMEQGDAELASKTFAVTAEWSEEKIVEQLKKIKWLAVSKLSQPKTEDGTAVLNLIASYELADGSKFKNRKVAFYLQKSQKTTTWSIDALSLEQLLSKQAAAYEEDDEPDDYSDWNVDNRL